MSELVKITCLFGYKKLVQVQKIEGSRIYMGGYSITYDRDGVEVSRTDPEFYSSIECHSKSQAKRFAEMGGHEVVK